jgi:hypothetical protein
MTHRIATFGKMTFHNDSQQNDTQHYILNILTFGKMTHITMGLGKMTLSIKTLNMTISTIIKLQHSEQHNVDCHYTKCHFAECCGTSGYTRNILIALDPHIVMKKIKT